MDKVQTILADNAAARANVEKFGKAVKAALEELHSDEVSRQNGLGRFQDGISEAMEVNNERIQAIFDPVANAYDQIRLLAAIIGVDLPEAEY